MEGETVQLCLLSIEWTVAKIFLRRYLDDGMHWREWCWILQGRFQLRVKGSCIGAWRNRVAHNASQRLGWVSLRIDDLDRTVAILTIHQMVYCGGGKAIMAMSKTTVHSV